MAQVPELLTASEVARALRVAPATVRRWAADDEIDHVRLPKGGLRFPASVLEQPMATVPAPEPAAAAP